ncbi:DUF7511 domain-containing protein [Natrialbaceae archaeon AArc-T1-2]|uniref:DUF7511 domain-containing protein n=1 Tax=Natrialbaceae archaeon AArc-T1-2 TaxID=3053904 RepID=UPI003D2F6BBA
MNDTPVGRADDEPTSAEPLELLADDDEWYTLVPVEATGEERLTQWFSVDNDVLCDLEKWR